MSLLEMSLLRFEAEILATVPLTLEVPSDPMIQVVSSLTEGAGEWNWDSGGITDVVKFA